MRKYWLLCSKPWQRSEGHDANPNLGFLCCIIRRAGYLILSLPFTRSLSSPSPYCPHLNDPVVAHKLVSFGPSFCPSVRLRILT